MSVARVITQEEAWETPAAFAASRCPRCKGRSTVWTFMAVCNEYAQSALNLCSCITRKKGYQP